MASSGSQSFGRAATVAAVLFAAACSGGSDTAEPVPSGTSDDDSTVVSEAPPLVADTAPVDDTSVVATTPVETDPVVDESCEFQSATMWGDELDDYFDALAEATNMDIVDTEGELRLVVTDEVVQYIRDVDMVVKTAGGVAEFRAINGVTTGWEFVDGVLRTSELVDDRSYIDTTIDGVEVEAEEIEELVGDLWATNPAEGMEFSCAGPTATLPLADTGERFTITLQPY